MSPILGLSLQDMTSWKSCDVIKVFRVNILMLVRCWPDIKSLADLAGIEMNQCKIEQKRRKPEQR